MSYIIKPVALTLGMVIWGLWTQTSKAAPGSDTWLGNTDNTWATGANWSPAVNAPPTGGDSLIFGVAGTQGASLTNNLGTNTAFNAMTFLAGASAFTFSGNAINLAGNITDNALNSETVNFPVAMTGSRICIVTNGGNLVLGGVISGTGFNLSVNTTTATGNALTPQNTGTLTLNGSAANTYTGSTIVSGGTLLLDFANLATPVNLISSSSPLTLGGLGGGTLSVKGQAGAVNTSQTLGSVTISKNLGSSIVLNPNGGTSTTLRLGNTWNRSGGANSLNIDLSLGGTLTSTPSVAVNNVLGFATVKDATGIGLASVSGGNIVRLTGQATLPTSGTSATNDYITSGNLTWGSTSFSVDSLTLNASSVPGVLDLGGANHVMTISSLGLLMFGANNYTIQDGQVGAANSEVIVHQMGAGILSINGTVSGGSGGITKNGTGTLVLSGTNSGSFVTINQGTVQQGVAQALGSAAMAFTVNNGATLDLNGFNLVVGQVAGSGTGQGVITNSGAQANFTVGNGNAAPDLANATVAGPINLIINGSGAVGLSPANTHTGGTTFQNNTGVASNYRVNVGAELGSGPLTFNGGGTLQNAASLIVTNAVAINSTGNTWWVDAGAYGSSGPWSGTGKINILQDVGKSPAFAFNGNMSGFQGTLLLSANTNANSAGVIFTYSLGGATTFDASQATWDLYSTLGTVSSAPLLQWAGIGSQAIELGDLNSTGTTGNGAIVVSNSVAGTSATFQVGYLNNNSTFAGAFVSGAGTIALSKVGSGTWTLSGANTYTGATTISNGTLLLNGSLAAGSAVTVAGGKLGGTGTVGGPVTFNAGSHAVFTNGASLTLNSSLIIATSGTLPDVHLALSNNVPVGNYTLATYNTSGSSGTFNSTPVVDSGSFAAGTSAIILTGGGSVVLQVTPPSVGTTTTVATSGSPSTYGQKVTFTATIAPASGMVVPTGTVQFNANGVALGSPVTVTTGTSPNGTASVSTATLPASVSDYSITAMYTATGNFTGSSSALSGGQTVNPASLTITARPNTKIYDGTASATNTPIITAGTLQGSDTATLTEAYQDATVGTGKTLIPSIAITNAGVNALPNYSVTSVNDTTGVINPVQATTSLVLTNSIGLTNNYGQTLIFTVLVQTNDVTATDASSNVVFSLGSTPVWTNAVVGGAAFYTNEDLTVGVTNITAQYLGDNVYLGSTLTVTQSVLQATPTLTLSASGITYGQSLSSSSLFGSVATNTYDANADSDSSVAGTFAFADNTITPDAGVTNVWVIFTPIDTTDYTTASNTVAVTVNMASSTVTVTGTTDFTYNGAGQGPASANVTGSGGAVSYSYSGTGYGPSVNTPTNAGSYTVTATVAADDNYNGASSTATTFNIDPALASVTADAKTKTYGTVNPGLSATVVGQVAGADAINYTLSTDAGQYSAAGVSNIYVTLGSNPNYNMSATNSTLTINQAGTFVGAFSSENPSGYKDGVFFTATLPSDATGSVVFSSANGGFSTNSANGGTATSESTTNLPRGTNVITVAYLGDGNYIGSTNILNQVVTNHPPAAGIMTVTRTAGLGLMFALSDLATNWSDVDGDTVELTSVTMQSTNGVNLVALNWSTNLDGSIVTTNGSAYISYPNSPNVNDQISYSISDGQGGTNIGYVNIVIQGSVTGTNAIAAYNFTSLNSNTITAYGIPYFYYILERSTNLSAPVWVGVQTNQAGPDGAINSTDEFLDLGGNKPNPAFYQLKWQQ